MYNNILDTIGNTPLVRINRLINKPNVEIYAKIEGTNPTGSIKDRIALKMIEQAEEEGSLVKGKTIIEATSGNTGISLAMIGTVKGYDVEIVMSSAVSIERQNMIKAFGANIVLTDSEQGTDGAIMEAKRRLKQFPDRYFTPDQFSNKYNQLAHYSTTAEEILTDTKGTVTHYVSALGTSGTLMGVGSRLKEYSDDIKIVSAHPVRGHYIQGLKNMSEAIVPSIYDENLIDITVMVESEQAFCMSRKIVTEEGIFVGMSSGAAMLAAIEVANQIESGLIVCVFADRGEKYLSTDLFLNTN
ncbi:MAG: cysteine synthase family protein [Oscillospiraceae bacterium]|nr:cysteine synthase family protein [Oscillospiraceae bacterium]